jgi:uncharacterized protein YndB with AHSA1/START domain
VITDKIEKQIVLAAPLERVWHAISDSKRFGQWFGVEVDGPFIAGQEAIGRIVPTMVDPEVASLQEPVRGMAWRVKVERIEPMRLLSFRWHPYAIDADADYSAEAMTKVTFRLTETASGVLLTITETGFDQLPTARRTPAFEANHGGWAHQAKLIAKYLVRTEG